MQLQPKQCINTEEVRDMGRLIKISSEGLWSNNLKKEKKKRAPTHFCLRDSHIGVTRTSYLPFLFMHINVTQSERTVKNISSHLELTFHNISGRVGTHRWSTQSLSSTTDKATARDFPQSVSVEFVINYRRRWRGGSPREEDRGGGGSEKEAGIASSRSDARLRVCGIFASTRVHIREDTRVKTWLLVRY